MSSPFISAIVIMRPPVVDIEGCKAALELLAGEVVVSEPAADDPPGSVPDIRALGDMATRCSGEWIMWVEPCETLVCPDPAAFLRTLAGIEGLDALQMMVDDVPVGRLGAPAVTTNLRLFRARALAVSSPSAATDTGQNGSSGADIAPPGPPTRATGERQGFFGLARLVRAGALAPAFRATNLQARLQALEAALSIDPSVSRDHAQSLACLGRALWRAGRPYEALECSKVACSSSDLAVRGFAAVDATRLAIELGRTDEAEGVVAALRGPAMRPWPGGALLAARLEGDIALASHEPERALELFAKLEGERESSRELRELREVHEVPAAFDGLATSKARALAAAGRHAEAAGVLLDALGSPTGDAGATNQSFGTLVEMASIGGMTPGEVASRIPPQRLPGVLTETLLLPAGTADSLLEALVERFAPGSSEHVHTLAAASMLASALAEERAVVWSRRLRQVGLQTLCPLMAVSRDQSFPGADRILCALAAHAELGDADAAPALMAAAAACGKTDIDEVRYAVSSRAPELLDDFDAARAEPPEVLCPLGDTATPPTISIVVLAYNRAESTRSCLESLARTLPRGLSYEIVVVDNASSDATPRLLEGAAGEVLAVRASTNLGFARGCNLGARLARGRIVVFMNNDVVALPGWAEPLVDALDRRDEVGAVGAKLLSPEGHVVHAGDRLIERGGQLDAVHMGAGLEPTDEAVANRREVASVTAAVLAMRHADFTELGGFDEGYWNGYEDVDLCLKVWSTGKRVLYEPASVLVHHESATRGDVRLRSLRGALVASRNLCRLNSTWLGRLPALVEVERRADTTTPAFPMEGITPGPVVSYQFMLDELARRATDVPARAKARPAVVSVMLASAQLRPADIEATIRSLEAQDHGEWELLVASGSTSTEAAELVEQAHARDPRIHGIVFEAPWAALAEATGDLFIAAGPGEDLDGHLLSAMSEALSSEPRAAFAYCDEDERHAHGHRAYPWFKPEWSPDLLMSVDYASHLSAYRTDKVRASGLVTRDFDVSLRYRLALLASERGQEPVHVALPLCSLDEPDAPSASHRPRLVARERLEADLDAVRETVRRRGLHAEVEPGRWQGSRRVRFELPGDTRVAVVVVASSPGDAERCTTSLRKDPGVSRPEVLPVLDAASQGFARSVNAAARSLSCDVLVVVDGALVTTAPGALAELASQALRPEVGAAGGQVIDARGLVVDEGVVLGVLGFAAACARTLSPYLHSVVGERSALGPACIAMRSEVFHESGGFDDAIAGDLAAVDFCLAVRSRGYKVLYSPFARFRAPDRCCATGRFTMERAGATAPVGIARTWRTEEPDTNRVVARWGPSGLLEDRYYSDHLSRDVPFTPVSFRR